jgi:hypothetical protein
MISANVHWIVATLIVSLLISIDKKHIDEEVKNSKGLPRACLLLNSRKQIIQSTFIPALDYGDIVYNATATVLIKQIGISL